MKQYRGMSINPCLNGFIVIVGCQTLVFANLHQVAEALHRYADDPEAEEKLYLENTRAFSGLENPVPTPPPTVRRDIAFIEPDTQASQSPPGVLSRPTR
jgi:hypothetical protein